MNLDQTTEAVVDKVAELLDLRIGLRADPTLRERLRRCVCDEAAALAMDMDAFLATVTAPSPRLDSLVDRVTVQETAFFRHPEHFEILARDILPVSRPPVTIWSAACANGQEAFSLAMVLAEQRIEGSVIATDLAESAVKRTVAARYHTRELAGLSPARIARYLTPADGGWQIDKTIRDRVAVFQHNLLTPVPARLRSCHIVFCRNVLIYFSPQHSRTFLDRLAEALPAGASVFVGSAETLWQITDRFEAVKIGNSFVHRLRSLAAPATGPKTGAAGTPRAPVAERRTRAALDPATPMSSRTGDAAQLAHAGQQAMAEGDNRAAVTAFRKWAYLTPADAMAHVHLGLSLEAAGDQDSAKRAYGVARRALLRADPALAEHAIEGYSADELRRFLAIKEQEEA